MNNNIYFLNPSQVANIVVGPEEMVVNKSNENLFLVGLTL